MRIADWPNCAIMVSLAAVNTPELTRIVVIPGQRSGQACIRGLRVTVRDVLETPATRH